jgi:hypothetical protein
MGPVGRPRRRLSPSSQGAAAHAARLAGLPPGEVLAAVVVAWAGAHRLDPQCFGPLGRVPPDRRGVPTGVGRTGWDAHASSSTEWTGAWAAGLVADDLGELHQALLEPEHRRRQGVHYTPAEVADEVVALAWGRWDEAHDELPRSVCDPACGGGAFLLAVARSLRARGLSPAEVLSRLYGIDVDALAVGVTVAALSMWAVSEGGVPPPVLPAVVAGDALDATVAWSDGGAAPDLVVGNPPFAGQLARHTARRAGADVRARRQLGRPAGYADTAALFLDRALGEVSEGGLVALVQPLSLLAARDTAPIRERSDPHLRDLWVPGKALFAASVHVCVPVLRRGDGGAGHPTDPAADDTVTVHAAVPPRGAGRVARARLEHHGGWAPLWACAAGVPVVDLSGRGTLGEWCSVTAGFRDEFYGLADLVEEARLDEHGRPTAAPGQARVVTAGLVDWAGDGWGRRAARIAGRTFVAPVVDVAAVRRSRSDRLAAVVEHRRRPKVVVAVQTRVVEALVDDVGDLWPSVPLVSVSPEPHRAVPAVDGLDEPTRRWMAATALLAPPVTAWALLESGGTARSPGAVKLSARQVRRVPLPLDPVTWREAAGLLRSGTEGGATAPDRSLTLRVGELLTAAHRLDGATEAAVLEWWADRLGR